MFPFLQDGHIWCFRGCSSLISTLPRVYSNPLRFFWLRLQYTILLLPSLICNLHCLNRAFTASKVRRACLKFWQWMIISSAYRSNFTSGWYFSNHLSNTKCRKVFAGNGLIAPPCGVPAIIPTNGKDFGRINSNNHFFDNNNTPDEKYLYL